MGGGSPWLRWLLVGAAPAWAGCYTFGASMGAGLATAAAEQAVATACNKAEAALGVAIDRKQWEEARFRLQRMQSTCQAQRYRAARQYLEEAQAADHPPPARRGPNLFPACLAHVESAGIPPWDSRFFSMIEAKTCSSEDLDDAVAVVLHKLEQRCRETAAAMHTRVSLGDVDGARTLVAGARRHCTPEQLEVMNRALEAASRAPPPN